MDYVFGLIIGILFLILIGGVEGAFWPLGKFLFRILHLQKYFPEERSKKNENIVDLAGLILYIFLIVTLIYLKNKLINNI